MAPRFCSLHFRHLQTDWFIRRRPALQTTPFVVSASDHGRKIVIAACPIAQTLGIQVGHVLADARVLCPGLEVLDELSGLPAKLLKKLALDLIRYTPVVAVDLPDGIVLDISGCSHLWGGEEPYLRAILNRLRSSGFQVRAAIADTIGAAWALARYGQGSSIHTPGSHLQSLLSLPPGALRLDMDIQARLFKLGLYRISQFASMPRSALRRRFGESLLLRIDQAFGRTEEFLDPVLPPPAYHERLPCLEPIVTRTGIEIALQQLLATLCTRLQKEGKGIRTTILKTYRVDGKIQEISVGTNRPSHSHPHLFKLFEENLGRIEPDLGIELFVLEAPKVEEVVQRQNSLWRESPAKLPSPGNPNLTNPNLLDANPGNPNPGRPSPGNPSPGNPNLIDPTLDDPNLAELLDRLTNKLGAHTLHRYLPAESHWPGRSCQPAISLDQLPASPWPMDRPRPIHLFPQPEPITVAAPIPDYPPMHFRYQGRLYKVVRADGPERIEDEWWLASDRIRDYYTVEDEGGARYWIFRSGFYTGSGSSPWFIHGIFS
jgi:protein ImuB